MKEFEFTLILASRDIDEEVADALFEAGCDDGTCGVQHGAGFVHFAREGESPRAAVASAIADVRKAGQEVVRVEPEGLLTAEEVGEILAPATGRAGA